MNWRHRIMVSFLVLWGFINLIALYIGSQPKTPDERAYYWDFRSNFFPFSTGTLTETYDFTEFMVYAVAPALLYFLYRYVKGEKEPLLP